MPIYIYKPQDQIKKSLMLASCEINSFPHNVPSDPQSRDSLQGCIASRRSQLSNPYLQYGHVRWQDGEHSLREECEVTENEDQKGFFQRIGPACGVSTASQRRMTPVPGPWTSTRLWACHCHVPPAIPHPSLLEWKYLMRMSFPYSNIVHWREVYILSMWKRATCGLGV